MFWIGIVIVAITVVLILTAKEELWMWAVPFMIMGIVFIGASGYRPLK